MDLTIILTRLGTVLAVIGSNIAIIYWLRSDIKIFESDLRSEFESDMNIFKSEVRGWREDLSKEMKDFHGRLCAIEERNRK